MLDLLFLKYRYRAPKKKNLLNKYLSEGDIGKCLEDMSKNFPGNEEINNIIQRIKDIEADTLNRMQGTIDIVVAY